MLTIHHSNRMERLVEALADALGQPLTDAWLEPETIIVQSRGMERYVNLGLARILGISANVRFPFPAAFAWEVYRAVLPGLPESSPFDKEVMTWWVLKLFAELDDPAMAPLRSYLERAANDAERFELAWRIADVFDQYLVYRPDWINRWEAGHESHWQAALWRRLLAAEMPHRARLQRAFVDKLAALEARPATMPARVSVIGISSLPQVYLEMLRALARLCRVDLYLLNPCREYWGMIRAELAIARACGEDETTAEELYLETGNRLLASLGRQGRDLHHLIAEMDASPDEWFEEPPQDSLLHCLQADILNLRNRGANSSRCQGTEHTGYSEDIAATPLNPDDRSLQVHVCHSALREVEVLYDGLLDLFQRNPGLRASDVVVMTPDIDGYAPAIRAVFSAAGTRIPFGIADRSLATESAVVESFMELLELADSRFEVNRVLGLLEVEAVRRRFEIGEADLPLISRWLRDTGVRWGIDADSRAALDLPATQEHTWRAGLQRLLLGYALPLGERRMYAGILPYDPVEGESARVMGRFQAFVQRLVTLHGHLTESAKPVSAWRTELLRGLDDLIASDDTFEAERNRVTEVLDGLARSADAAGFGQSVPLPVVRAWLRRQLAASTSVSGFLAGGVTFCAMVPMRSVPFRVICLIGLNDGVFPRPERPVDFDLMAKKPRRGDRSRRLDDRYLFLEALLSARETLYLSYVGRSIRDNTLIPPSPLVSELLDYVRQGFYPAGDEHADSLVRVRIEHPLQAFSPVYFTGGENLFSYSAMLCEAARHAGLGKEQGRPLLTGPLPQADPEYRLLDIQQLIGFLQNPARYFLRQRLGVELLERDGPLESSEPFVLKPFVDRDIRKRVLERRLEGLRPGEILPLVRAVGMLPHGNVGEALYFREARQVKPLLRALTETPLCSGEKLEVNLRIGDFQLGGWLAEVTAEGLRGYTVDRLGARHYLDWWVRHLVLNELEIPGVAAVSTLLSPGEPLKFRPVEDPRDHLTDLLSLYWQGLMVPLKFFPRSALAYLETESAGGAEPMQKARSCWEGSSFHRGEGDNPYYRLAFRYQQPLDHEFAALARQVLGPLLDHREPVE